MFSKVIQIGNTKHTHSLTSILSSISYASTTKFTLMLRFSVLHCSERTDILIRKCDFKYGLEHQKNFEEKAKTLECKKAKLEEMRNCERNVKRITKEGE